MRTGRMVCTCLAVMAVMFPVLAAGTQRAAIAAQTPKAPDESQVFPSTPSPVPAGFGPGIEILTSRVPPTALAAPVLPDNGALDIDSSTAVRIGLNKLTQRYGPGLRLLSVLPLVDIHDAVIAYDIDVALPGCPYSTYGEIASYWQDYFASAPRHSVPKYKRGQGDSLGSALPDQDDSGLVIASITVSASYDYPAVRSYTRTPSSFYSSGWVAQEIAAQVLSYAGPVQLEKTYLTGPGARSFVFRAGGRRVVVEGQEPFAWYDYDSFHAACLTSEQQRVAGVTQSLREKGLDFNLTRDSIRANRRTAVQAAAVSATITPDTFLVPSPSCVQPLEWQNGCGPTSAAMVLEYWDNYSWYGKLNRYYVWRKHVRTGNEVCHTSTAQTELAQYLDTDSWGVTQFPKVEPGMINYANANGYCFSGDGIWIGGFLDWHWDDIRSDIDHGYPFVWGLGWCPGANGGRHDVAAFGYTDIGEVICYNTWSAVPICVNHEGGFFDYSGGATPHPGCPIPYDLKIVSPDGWQTFACVPAAEYYGGDLLDITWNNRGRPADHVFISLSTDAGHNFVPIDRAPDNGLYTWTIPCDINSATCRIRIAQCSDFGGTVVSEDGSFGDFSILPGTAPVTAGMSGLPGTVSAGQTVILTALAGSANPTVWSWSSNCGGSFGSPGSRTTSWTAPVGYEGACQIAVTVTNCYGSTSGSSTTNVVMQPGTPTITGLPGTVCAGQTYDLSATASGNPTSWSWSSNGGGSFGSPSSSTTTWTAPVGSCWVTLQISVVATNTSGSTPGYASTQVKDKPFLAAITGLPAAACGGGQTYSLGVPYACTPTGWSWSSSCGGTFGSQGSSTTTWTSPPAFSGSCQISATANNACGSTTVIASITIDQQPPGTSIIIGPSEVYGGIPVTLAASASNSPTGWNWSSACGGTFDPPTGNPTAWTPPCVSGACQVSVSGTNGCGSGNAGTTSINITRLPGTPTGLTVSKNCRTLTARWDSVPGAIWYRIYRDFVLHDSTQLRVHVDIDMVGTHAYAMSAVGVCGASGQSAQVFQTADPGPPAPPTGLTCVSGCRTIALNWNPVPGATLYQIYRNSYPYAQSQVPWYQDINALPASMDFCYWVAAVNDCGMGGGTAESCCRSNSDAAGGTGINYFNPLCDSIVMGLVLDPQALRYIIYRDGLRYDSTTIPYYVDIHPGTTQQCYKATVRRACGEGPQSGQMCGKAIPSIPEVPPGVTSATVCSTIKLSWGIDYGAFKFIIYRDGARYDSISSLTYTDIASGSAQRCYTVSAKGCGGGESGQSPPTCATANPATLGVPAGLTCTGGCGSISLNWTPVAGATKYIIHRDGLRYDSTTTISFTDAVPGTSQRCYTVTAANGCTTSSPSLQSCCTAHSTAPLGAPSALVCTPGCGAIALNWSVVSGATMYIVYRDGTRHDSTTVPFYVDPTPGPAQRCFSVSAANGCGESGLSTQSCCAANLAVPEIPSRLVCIPGCGVLTLGWEGASGTSLYFILRDGVLYDTTSLTTYIDHTPGSTQRCYAVSARNACGESSQSSQSCGVSNTAAPNVPSNLSCTPDTGMVTLAWTAVPGAIRYVVFRDGARYDSIGGLPYSDLAPGPTQRCYTLLAKNACGESDQSLSACGVAMPACSCPNQSDIDGSGFIDVTDVLKVIQIAFTNGVDVQDPQCPTTCGDVNNSGVVDVNDVLYIIKTAFTNGPDPVDPCGW